MQDHYRRIVEKIKDQLKMVDIVLDFKKELVTDQHENTSMK